eukprot:365141-Chlamydomonas_euryale.AAC.4
MPTLASVTSAFAFWKLQYASALARSADATLSGSMLACQGVLKKARKGWLVSGKGRWAGRAGRGWSAVSKIAAPDHPSTPYHRDHPSKPYYTTRPVISVIPPPSLPPTVDQGTALGAWRTCCIG